MSTGLFVILLFVVGLVIGGLVAIYKGKQGKPKL